MLVAVWRWRRALFQRKAVLAEACSGVAMVKLVKAEFGVAERGCCYNIFTFSG
jgi:hypothetical protein